MALTLVYTFHLQWSWVIRIRWLAFPWNCDMKVSLCLPRALLLSRESEHVGHEDFPTHIKRQTFLSQDWFFNRRKLWSQGFRITLCIPVERNSQILELLKSFPSRVSSQYDWIRWVFFLFGNDYDFCFFFVQFNAVLPAFCDGKVEQCFDFLTIWPQWTLADCW